MSMRSMTGFGKGTSRGAAGACEVHIQSVNGRYSKIGVALPAELSALETGVRRFLQGRVGRGKVSVSVSFSPAGGAPDRPVIDRKACRDLATQMRKVQRWLGLEGPIGMRDLLMTGGVITRKGAPIPVRPAWALVRRALASACEDLAASQIREGKALGKDILKRWRRIDALTWKVDELKKGSVRRYERRLRDKVRTVLEGEMCDERQLLAAVTLYADRVDYTEEIVRLRAHLASFRRLLSARGEVGKKLDFTVQEMLREANTCSNKANDERVSRIIIEIKAELEKIREQLQNIQ